MRYTAKVYSGAFVLGLGGLWSTSAHAIPECGSGCSYQPQITVHTPARITNAVAGTVALTGNSGDTAAALLAPIAGALGLHFYHAEVLYDASGDTFTETEWNGVTPPSSEKTGEPHICTRLISPFYLASLSPGAVSGIYEDAVSPSTLIAGFGTAGCTVPADGYRLNSLINGSAPGGSCEKLLKDYCGVPVNNASIAAGGDGTVYNSSQASNALFGSNGVFYDAYNACMGTIGGSYITILGIGGIGCGGDSEQNMCRRAGWQAINEIMFPAYPFGYVSPNSIWSYEAGPLAPNGVDNYLDGWSDFSTGAPPTVGVYPPAGYNTWSGTMHGGGKVVSEYASANEAPETLCPGACDNNGCTNAPLACPEYEPTAWLANVPDNIMHAATRLGRPTTLVSTGSGITAGYNTTYPARCVCD